MRPRPRSENRCIRTPATPPAAALTRGRFLAALAGGLLATAGTTTLAAAETAEALVPTAKIARRHRGPTMRALEPLLLQQARHLIAELQPSPVGRSAARLPLLKGPAWGEHGIRPNAHTAKGLALVYRLVPDEAFPADFPRTLARDHALALLRHLLPTYATAPAPDAKPWGQQWQSAYWATLTGEACWLLWDDLSPAERSLATRMIAAEAERFVDAVPPAAIVRDSKGEENAWNSQVLSLAGLMFPRHPRAAAWRRAAVRWISSSFARPADLARTDVVDGRPLREWIAGANLHDDFTLENHGRVHPDYMACTYLLTSQAPLYAWAGRAAPAALRLNVATINASLKRLALPDGAWIYPNGQDWGLRRNIDWLEYHTALAVLENDAESARLQRQCLATVERMAARQPRGPIYLTEETKLPSDQSMALELPAHAYALMAEFGEGPEPVALERLMENLTGKHVFASGKFAVMRTPRAIATFSWGAQVMGQVMPLAENQLLAPEARGLVGYVGIAGLAREAPEVREVSVAPLATAFGVAGVLGRGGGAVEQRFAFLALPDGRVVYADQVRLTGGIRPTLLDLGTLGVLNDRHWPAHSGQRRLAHAGGTRIFAAADATREAPATFASRWFNLDGLGVVRLAANGIARYVPAPSGAAGRLEQRFHLNAIPTEKLAEAPPGAEVAHSVVVFYPGQTAAETEAASGAGRLESAPGAPAVRLTLEDGGVVTLDLTRLNVAWTPRG